MNYGSLIYNKIKILFFESLRTFSNQLDLLKCVCVLLVCFVLQIVIFNALTGCCVIFCIYEDVLKICFKIF